jgi:hypothetical protein
MCRTPVFAKITHQRICHLSDTIIAFDEAAMNFVLDPVDIPQEAEKVANFCKRARATLQNWRNSFGDCLALPSAKFAGIDMAARRIWSVRPYLSLDGNRSDNR